VRWRKDERFAQIAIKEVIRILRVAFLIPFIVKRLPERELEVVLAVRVRVGER